VDSVIPRALHFVDDPEESVIMVISFLSWTAVLIILVTSSGLLLSRDWRWSLGLFAMQYLGSFWLVTRHWPVGMAAVKLVTGWMVIAALAMTLLPLSQKDQTEEQFLPQGVPFRLFASVVTALIVLAAAPRLEAATPGLGLPVIAGSLLPIGMGLLLLGSTSDIFRVILGLLTMLTGFETLYAAVEGSVLVAGLLAVVDLGLALVGAYLISNSYNDTPSDLEEPV
jgi:hypothetical protein